MNYKLYIIILTNTLRFGLLVYGTCIIYLNVIYLYNVVEIILLDKLCVWCG